MVTQGLLYTRMTRDCRLLRLLRLVRVAQLLFRSPKTTVGIPSFFNRAWIALAQIGYAAAFLINLLGCLWCEPWPFSLVLIRVWTQH